jgi:hypothetical protein
MRAAALCLQHENPKLEVSMVVNREQDFAAILDLRIARLKELEQAKLIEAQPHPAVEIKPPLPRIPDRRFRRI